VARQRTPVDWPTGSRLGRSERGATPISQGFGSLCDRAWCYQALGQPDRGRADARTALEGIGNSNVNYYQFQERMRCYLILNQPREAAEDAVRLHNTQRLREWFDKNFKENIELHGGAHDTFLLAMVYWKLGQEEYARRWYDTAVERIDKSKPEDETLRRFHEEAAALLAAEERSPATCERLASTLGLDLAAYRACVADPATDREIDRRVEAWMKRIIRACP